MNFLKTLKSPPMIDYETNSLTPVFNDPKPCPNKDCKDGFIYTEYWDYDNNCTVPEKEKCTWCDENGHLKE